MQCVFIVHEWVQCGFIGAADDEFAVECTIYFGLERFAVILTDFSIFIEFISLGSVRFEL